MDYRIKYEQWLDSPIIDEETKKELMTIAHDDKEIEERFYKDLEFGTGGLRGIIGAGTNRINKYTVGKATQGFANYIIKQGKEAMDRGVAIAYDSRWMSPEFAERVATVLNANGIKAYLYSELQPTPVLSFSVRELGAVAGVVITASHNPPEYNGYKVYWEDGAQVALERANDIILEINQIEDFGQIKNMDKEKALNEGLLTIIGEEVLKKYLDLVVGLSNNPKIVEEMADDFKIIYTPLHGSGNKPVRRVLNALGFKNVSVVPEQEYPDPDFTTVGYPNPEERRVFKMAIDMAHKEGADIIIGTDPDCDRVGVVVKDTNGEFMVLTGNQVGVLLVDYVLKSMAESKGLPENGTIVTTVVTSDMGGKIAESYGVETMETLTGFKFIGEKIKEFKASGKHTYLFGYEESNGYLAGDFVRDKDAVSASMLVCEMGAYYKSKNMSLYDALIELWNQHGFYCEDLKSIEIEGKEGMARISEIMGDLRDRPPNQLAGNKIVIMDDYKSGKSWDLINKTQKVIDLPISDVLVYKMEDSSWFAIRPSGTEPKIKLYFSTVGKSIEDSRDKMNRLIKDATARVEQ